MTGCEEMYETLQELEQQIENCQELRAAGIARRLELENDLEDLKVKLHAAEVERDAALFQLHEQNRKLDAAVLAVESLREEL